MAQRVCVVVDAAERVLLPDDSHRRLFGLLDSARRQDGSPVHVKPWSRPRGAMPRRMGGVDPRQLVTAHPSGKEKAPRGDVALSG
jgi:hypothetical protein